MNIDPKLTEKAKNLNIKYLAAGFVVIGFILAMATPFFISIMLITLVVGLVFGGYIWMKELEQKVNHSEEKKELDE